mmetsp:Transcript_4248/g.15603  ORF Transcript_4248/g.15603 Transcript_4248/m.15603 type:complete len:269 (-) Transcript_4248:333-1139(-)
MRRRPHGRAPRGNAVRHRRPRRPRLGHGPRHVRPRRHRREGARQDGLVRRRAREPRPELGRDWRRHQHGQTRVCNRRAPRATRAARRQGLAVRAEQRRRLQDPGGRARGRPNRRRQPRRRAASRPRGAARHGGPRHPPRLRAAGRRHARGPRRGETPRAHFADGLRPGATLAPAGAVILPHSPQRSSLKGQTEPGLSQPRGTIHLKCDVANKTRFAVVLATPWGPSCGSSACRDDEDIPEGRDTVSIPLREYREYVATTLRAGARRRG